MNKAHIAGGLAGARMMENQRLAEHEGSGG